MESIADVARREQVAEVLRLPPHERIALALELHRRDVELFRFAHDPPLDVAEAERLLRLARRRGRVRSACVEAIEG